MRNSSALLVLLAASGSVFAGGFSAPIIVQSSTLTPPINLFPKPPVVPPAQSEPAPQPVADVAPPAADRPASVAGPVRIVIDPATGERKLELPQSILFPVADSGLNAGYDAMLAQVVAVLNASPADKLSVIGNTDSTANDSYNMGLSVERANVVAIALVAKGLNASRLVVRGAGEANPVADNSTDAGRTANRRTDLVLIKP